MHLDASNFGVLFIFILHVENLKVHKDVDKHPDNIALINIKNCKDNELVHGVLEIDD